MDTLPGSDAQDLREGRLSNVSGVVTGGSRDADTSVTALRALLERVCQDVVVRRSGPNESPLSALVAVLEMSEAERVLVLDARAPAASPELVFALVAWPECPIVHPAGSWSSAIYLRESVLPVARDSLAAGSTEGAALTATLEVSELDGDDLTAVSEAD